MACKEKFMIDVRIDAPDGHFKFRVSGVLKVGERYLFIKMNDNKFFCMPGGHVELGESSEAATLREMEEELGFKVKITKSLGQIENFFYGRKDGAVWHELGYYYEVEPENINDVCLKDFSRIENDKGFMQRLYFKWMTIDEAEKEEFKPESLIRLLKSDQPVHLICDYRGKEAKND